MDTKLFFHHICLEVKNLERSCSFYCCLFGFHKVLEYPGQIIHLKIDKQNFILELKKGESRDCVKNIHLGFYCSNINNFKKTIFNTFPEIYISDLKRIGDENIIFIKDFDGYLIELNEGLK